MKEKIQVQERRDSTRQLKQKYIDKPESLSVY